MPKVTNRLEYIKQFFLNREADKKELDIEIEDSDYVNDFIYDFDCSQYNNCTIKCEEQ